MICTMSTRGSILVIDDDDELRQTLCDVLDQEGYEVLSAAGGVEALEILRGGARPQLILLDLMMPGMSGWQMRERQLADPALAGIPVVVMTAIGTVDGLPVGDKVLLKPVRLEALLETVERYCPVS
jgi:CheY-like chemotaxis protein